MRQVFNLAQVYAMVGKVKLVSSAATCQHLRGNFDLVHWQLDLDYLFCS